MDREYAVKKLQAFKEKLEIFKAGKKPGVEEVHRLRTATRELYSMLDCLDEYCPKLKRVIKLSNEMRDIDVFFETFLDVLPKKIVQKLDAKAIRKEADAKRKKRLDKFITYLEGLEVPETLELSTQKDAKNDTRKIQQVHQLSSVEKDELHKYRIFIKKKLYKEKNNVTRDEDKVVVLADIKDCLGTINDNLNGIERLRTFDIKEKILKQVESYIDNENVRLLKEFQALNTKLLQIESDRLQNLFDTYALKAFEYMLVRDGVEWELAEIEVYLIDPQSGVEDPFIHKHPEQNEFERLYWHFSGVDICLGDGQDIYCGVLVRGVMQGDETVFGPGRVAYSYPKRDRRDLVFKKNVYNYSEKLKFSDASSGKDELRNVVFRLPRVNLSAEEMKKGLQGDLMHLQEFMNVKARYLRIKDENFSSPKRNAPEDHEEVFKALIEYKLKSSHD